MSFQDDIEGMRIDDAEFEAVSERADVAYFEEMLI